MLIFNFETMDKNGHCTVMIARGRRRRRRGGGGGGLAAPT